MTADTKPQLANFIWSICNLLRGPYKRNEYRKVILPLTVLRRFDCLLAPSKAKVLAEHPKIKAKPETVVRSLLEKITGRPFYNLSKLDLPRLLDDPNQLAPNLNAYINGFSPNVRAIMERFAIDQQVAKMAEKNLLYEVVKAFAAIDLSPARVDNSQMGYAFEELIRIGAEQANEEAGEHFTPREGIKLIVNLGVNYGRAGNSGGNTYPDGVFIGPMATILDERSSSDGDIFAYMFREAKLGTVVGRRSWGGVVGIGGGVPLIDGGSISVPGSGLASADGKWVIEGYGVDPDINVENDPKSVIAGHDPQLERTVAELMKQLAGKKVKLPPMPAAPVKAPR